MWMRTDSVPRKPFRAKGKTGAEDCRRDCENVIAVGNQDMSTKRERPCAALGPSKLKARAYKKTVVKYPHLLPNLILDTQKSGGVFWEVWSLETSP